MQRPGARDFGPGGGLDRRCGNGCARHSAGRSEQTKIKQPSQRGGLFARAKHSDVIGWRSPTKSGANKMAVALRTSY